MGRLDGQRLLLVGASSGIGHATASVLAAEGARLIVSARRVDRLAALCAEIENATPHACDVRDERACAALVEASVTALGGLDGLVYASGVAPLRRVGEARAEDWHAALEVNAIGASLVTRAALPALVASRGRAIYLSSITVDDKPPRIGIGLYVTAKAALNRMIELWQAECPEVAFTRIAVGDTGATEMGVGWDPEHGQEVVQSWLARGLMVGRAMEPEAVGRHVADLLCASEIVAVSRIIPRPRAAAHDPG